MNDEPGYVCGTCGAFMSADAQPFHSCTVFRRRRQSHGFTGVVEVDGVWFVSRMTPAGNIREHDERIAA